MRFLQRLRAAVDRAMAVVYAIGQCLHPRHPAHSRGASSFSCRALYARIEPDGQRLLASLAARSRLRMDQLFEVQRLDWAEGVCYGVAGRRVVSCVCRALCVRCVLLGVRRYRGPDWWIYRELPPHTHASSVTTLACARG